MRLVTCRLVVAFVLVGLCFTETGTAVSPKTRKNSNSSKRVDIRAFGDAGFTGGPSAIAQPPAHWVKSRLSALQPYRSRDINLLNLEGTVSQKCSTFAAKAYAFVMSPDIVGQFARWGFNIFGLANNHALDCWRPFAATGIDKVMRGAVRGLPGIAWHGVASKPEQLWNRIALLEKRGVRIGMVALKAWGSGANVPVANLYHVDRVLRALAVADVHVRILSLHGGTEGAIAPTRMMVNIARLFVAKYKGDLVFGHHPHRIQGFEILEKRDKRMAVIFYSLGNFLHNGLNAAGSGMMARVLVDKQGLRRKSVFVFPLASPSVRPGPADQRLWARSNSQWLQSNKVINRLPLPEGVQRLDFSLKPVSKRIRGYRLIPGKKPTPNPVISRAKSGVRLIKSGPVRKKR